MAKATLYSTFGSKDELIRAYLADRHVVRRQRMIEGLADYSSARERLLGVYDVLGQLFAEPGYRGCAFINASAETQSGSPIIEVADEYRAWVRTLFLDLAREAGAAEPDLLAQKLVLLYDGAGVAARMDRNPNSAAIAKAVAVTLINAAIPEQHRG